MLALWVSETAAYNTAHGTGIVATASLGGKVKGKSLNLEEPAVRANMLAGIEQVLSLGVGAVSLDLEPYPTSRGFVLMESWSTSDGTTARSRSTDSASNLARLRR